MSLFAPPNGLPAPKAATFSENVTEKLSSVLGLIASSLAGKKEEPLSPAVLPSQPAAAVDFDFDGDGKAPHLAPRFRHGLPSSVLLPQFQPF